MKWMHVAAVFALALASSAVPAHEVWAAGAPSRAPSRAIAETAPIFADAPARGGFQLVGAGVVPTLVVDPADAAVVRHAAQDLSDDIETVTGQRSAVAAAPAGKTAIFIGTLGQSPLIDQLVAAKRLDVSKLKGAWESFIIASVDRPAPGVDKGLVVIGSDRRGTAFGVYEVAQAMGVSPWAWWADVTPQRREALFVRAGVHRFGPPSVRYRGIFVNDEDWGLYPWAVKTFDPERGDIGPKTYRKIDLHPAAAPEGQHPVAGHAPHDRAVQFRSRQRQAGRGVRHRHGLVPRRGHAAQQCRRVEGRPGQVQLRDQPRRREGLLGRAGQDQRRL